METTQVVQDKPTPPVPSGFEVSERYRSYVVWILFAVYVFNFVDRQILTILIQPIKEEFDFSDTQLGLLGGLSFALLYSTLGIPIASWADRGGNRVSIIAGSLFLWSLFTAATGMARSFSHFLLARVAVGIGEAGCSPPAYSLISDYFPPERRSTAISIYSMGIYGGVFIGFLVGGFVAQEHGWRMAFYLVGLPGTLLAIVLKLTLREPPRGYSENLKAEGEPPAVGEVLRALWGRPAFRNLALASALHAFVGYGVAGFNSAFLMRSHGMNVAQVGFWSAIITALGGFAGTYFGGVLADRYAQRTGDPRYQLWVPGISTFLNVPIAVLTYVLPQTWLVLLLGLPSLAIGSMYLGPSFAITHRLCGVRERALSGALLLFVINLIGLGLGPLLTGVTSDVLKQRFVSGGMAETLAAGEGLRWALCLMMFVNVWSGYHYMRSARTLREDIASVRT
jgi:MFS family permease